MCIEPTRIVVDLKITGQSLVGVGIERPAKDGNYCWIAAGRVVNMWAENIKYLAPKLGGSASALKFGECIVVDDPRISSEWVLTVPCFTRAGASKQAIRGVMQHFFPTLLPDVCFCEQGVHYWSSMLAIFDDAGRDVVGHNCRCMGCGQNWKKLDGEKITKVLL